MTTNTPPLATVLSVAALFGAIAACSSAPAAVGSAAVDGAPGPGGTSSADLPGTLPNAPDGPAAVAAGDDAGCAAFDVLLASLTSHNTSASPTYDQAHFPANFGTASWVSQGGATIAVDPNARDLSLNPVTPAHVSRMDVHTLVPSRPDLRWFAHITPWFKTGGGNHIDIGVNNDSDAYAAAMITDMKNRGFDGVIVDWYGKNSYEDSVTLRIQKALKAIAGNTFKLILQMDKGVSGLSQTVLQQQVVYAQTQYFGDPNYELEGTKPILMFFGVESAVGSAAMDAVKTATGGNMVWVVQGTGSLSASWVDQAFDWTHDFHNGVDAADPYNLTAVQQFYSAVAASPKKAFGSMVAGFDGTLTKSVAWSKGKYMPRGSGACLVQWAKKIDAVIPANVTRMQWATWSDWEEGSAIEAGVENDAAVTLHASGAALSWTTTTGTGDESTIDHYEIYASEDGMHGKRLGTAAAGTHSFALASGATCLASGTTYVFQVVAVGKPSIRDHASAAVSLRMP